MGDLINDWPSWGQTGEYPVDGFFYDGGDQVNEKHFDALWNGLDVHVSNLNTAIRDRVRDLDGNVVLDEGLNPSLGSGTRETDVTGSTDGAYVDGEPTGSISSTTITHTSTGSSRTDVIYVDKNGNISKSEGTTTVPNNELKIAEVDVASNDSLTIRDHTRYYIDAVASGEAPSDPEPGHYWYEDNTNTLYIYNGASWDQYASDADTGAIAGDGLKAGSGLTINIEPTDFAGHGLEDDGADNLRIDGADLGVGINGGDGTDLSLDESVIKDGGAKEVDAAELDGSSGSGGQVLTTDGSSPSWDVPYEPMLGSGSLGSITDSSNLTRGGFLDCTNYTLEAGNTVTVDDADGALVITATEKITINGTINGVGKGGAGGTQSTQSSGENGSILPEGKGGAGGDNATTHGGDGGDGDTRLFTAIDRAAAGPMPIITQYGTECSAGGGKGDAPNLEDTAISGCEQGHDGSPPGGGGSGALADSDQSWSFAGSADGGDGGAMVILIAPEIEIGGTINVDATDGQDGDSNTNSDGLGGGGGGGGTGGLIYLSSKTRIENSPTFRANKGLGGAAGTGGACDGGAGADGAPGVIIKA